MSGSGETRFTISFHKYVFTLSAHSHPLTRFAAPLHPPQSIYLFLSLRPFAFALARFVLEPKKTYTMLSTGPTLTDTRGYRPPPKVTLAVFIAHEKITQKHQKKTYNSCSLYTVLLSDAYKHRGGRAHAFICFSHAYNITYLNTPYIQYAWYIEILAFALTYIYTLQVCFTKMKKRHFLLWAFLDVNNFVVICGRVSVCV